MAKNRPKPRKCSSTEVPKDVIATLGRCERDFHEGRREELFLAIALCGSHEIPLPGWVTDEVTEAYQRYSTAEAWTLDEAFRIEGRMGRDGKKGRHRAAARDWNEKAYLVYVEVEHHRRNGAGLGSELYARVGLKYNISDRTARRYYEEIRGSLRPTK